MVKRCEAYSLGRTPEDCRWVGSVLRRLNSLAVVDDPLGFLEPESKVHLLRGGVLEFRIRGKLGAADSSCPLLDGIAELTGHSAPSPAWLHVYSFEERDRRRRAPVDVITAQRRFCKSYRHTLR